ncbi:MAG: FtsQ-type POTRA domain-containing protein [Myxococcales bacterium]|nr:FtsQ-type POTRA domain-containing protein [Myxococcales bacterium]
MRGQTLAVEIPRRRRRKANRRVMLERRPLFVALAEGLATGARGGAGVLRRLARPVAVVGFLVGVVFGGRWALEHVLESPRFAVAQILVGPVERVSSSEIIALAAVRPGERLLALDPDAIAARVARHPWVQSVHVERKLPSTLQIDVIERRVAAAAMLGGLYLVDPEGLPFKRATTSEAAGLVVLTGLDRQRYTEEPAAVRAAYKQALKLLETYRAVTSRPPLSEVRIDARYGFSLYFLDTGAEVRLGREAHGEKLARLDQILDALENAGLDGPGSLRVVHLDGSPKSRVSLRLTLGDS